MKIIAIETSCDETAVSVVKSDNFGVQVLANTVSSQVKLHAKWGGVVPSLAAREHLKNFITVLDQSLSKSKTKPNDIDVIAVTQGPGLIPALLVGANAAKTLAYVWNKPLVGIHHIEGHIYANFIGINSKFEIRNSKLTKARLFPPPINRGIHQSQSFFQIQNSDIKFPILCLVVSGGHTQLVLMKKHLNYEIIGETLDDAAGEAFDKVARILGLGYPGGPAISATAEKFEIRNSKFEIHLPRPMLNSSDFNFSFSGLKTAVLYKVKKLQPKAGPPMAEKTINYKLKTELCHEFQQAVIDVLVAKTIKAARRYQPKTIMLAGGVSANQELRQQLGEKILKEFPNTKYQLPDTKYSIDNAAMIAAAAFFRWKKLTASQKKKSLQNWRTLESEANLKLE